MLEQLGTAYLLISANIIYDSSGLFPGAGRLSILHTWGYIDNSDNDYVTIYAHKSYQPQCARTHKRRQCHCCENLWYRYGQVTLGYSIVHVNVSVVY